MRSYEFILTEAFDNPYRYVGRWEEDEDNQPYDEESDGEYNLGDRIAPVQIMRFTTEAGVKYLWYARQNRYDPSSFEIAFGIEGKVGHKGEIDININKTNTGDQYRVYATALRIMKDFVEYFEDDVQSLTFTANKEDGSNRASLYKRILNTHIPDGFKIDDITENQFECHFRLVRNYR